MDRTVACESFRLWLWEYHQVSNLNRLVGSSFEGANEWSEEGQLLGVWVALLAVGNNKKVEISVF
ncbi:hypothetical protein MA16_Dca005534 [Dendrobium catenatum]|uniref:Uncharacterized protein n=1 Tax=Dendrobium catenatum TaxID=906689 RepID=A0A2I0WPV8_9ASPA|nr:hypothetical protein MA16_Dca005534 [Dendrobium catenatum]